MIIRIFILLLACLLVGSASAQITMTGVGPGSSTSGCSNALDFSDQCNSQYLGMMRL